MVSCETASWKLQPANGSPDSSEEGLVWQRLSVLPNGEVRTTTQIPVNHSIYDVCPPCTYQSLLLLACAGALPNSNTNSDFETDSLNTRAHAYIYELSFDDDQGLYEPSLEPLGHWPVDGSIESVVLHREMDGKSCMAWL